MKKTKVVFPRDMSNGGRLSWHWPSEAKEILSACGRAVLITDDPYKPDEVPAENRCMASGCRQRWQDFDRIAASGAI